MLNDKLDHPYYDQVAYLGTANASLTTATENAATAHHIWEKNPTTKIHYTTTTGHLTTKGANGKPEASIFYVAYTLDGGDAAKRPITFFWNGGPGSATLSLHLGAWSPWRILTGVPDVKVHSFPVINSTDSLLEDSDLVYIDACGTGYSQAIWPNHNQTFFSDTTDSAVFSHFIHRYLEVTQRKLAPIYLYGESYGGIRCCIVAQLLEEIGGLNLRGVILHSPILNYDYQRDVPADSLVSIAAVTTFHGRSDRRDGTSLSDYLKDVRTFAFGVYYPAVQSLLHQETPLSSEVLNRLAAITGLSTQDISDSAPYLDGAVMCKLLPNLILDMDDGRMASPQGQHPRYRQAFADTQRAYFSGILKYTCDAPYTTLSTTSWNGDIQDAIPYLESSLLKNPELKILAISGYHDLNVPFTTVEHELLRLKKSNNTRIHVFEGGHMTYLNEDSRSQIKSVLSKFYTF